MQTTKAEKELVLNFRGAEPASRLLLLRKSRDFSLMGARALYQEENILEGYRSCTDELQASLRRVVADSSAATRVIKRRLAKAAETEAKSQ